MNYPTHDSKRHYFSNDLDDTIRFQISKVTGCALTEFGELPFDYRNGGCNTFSFGVMLCFSLAVAPVHRSCYS